MNPLIKLVKGGLFKAAIPACANLIANWLDGYGDPTRAVNPQMLEALAAGGQNVILQALSRADGKAVAFVRSTYQNIAPDFRRVHYGPNGQYLGHPYMWVVQDLARSERHRAHADVIMRHLTWYRANMDQTMDWLFGPVSGSGSGSAQQ